MLSKGINAKKECRFLFQRRDPLHYPHIHIRDRMLYLHEKGVLNNNRNTKEPTVRNTEIKTPNVKTIFWQLYHTENTVCHPRLESADYSDIWPISSGEENRRMRAFPKSTSEKMGGTGKPGIWTIERQGNSQKNNTIMKIFQLRSLNKEGRRTDRLKHRDRSSRKE